MKLTKIVKFLNDELKPQSSSDNSYNGLQVEGKEEVKKICMAVDATLQTINLAIKKGADLLIVHHGLFWGREQPISGLHGKRIKALIDSGMSLYASHHPLDSHPQFGNNAVIGKLLGIKNLYQFGTYKDESWGFRGNIASTPMDKFVKKVETVLRAKVHVLSFGPKDVKRIGIVSGAGGFAVEEAAELGLDVLITGEARHKAYGEARDLGISVIFAGHYHTEVFGLLGLEKLIEKRLSVDCVFIPAPSGL